MIANPIGEAVSVMRHLAIPRAATIVALLAASTFMGACASDGTERQAAAPVPIASAPEQLAERLPAQAAGFRRGATAPVQQPSRGVEVAYSTGGRSAAGFVQVLGAPGPLADGVQSEAVQAEYRRWLDETARGAASRRLRVASESMQPPQSPLFRCAEMEGTYGRQPVQSVLCVGAAGGQMLRLRVSMPRRDPPVADFRAFIRDITAALRAAS